MKMRIQFISPRCKLWHTLCELDRTRGQADRSDIRIDIEQFCLRMYQAAKSYYDQVHKEKISAFTIRRFLDFIQIRQKVRTDDLLIIMHGNKAYANGLKAVLEAFPGHILCFSTWEEKRKTGKSEAIYLDPVREIGRGGRSNRE